MVICLPSKAAPPDVRRLTRQGEAHLFERPRDLVASLHRWWAGRVVPPVSGRVQGFTSRSGLCAIERRASVC